MSDSEWKRPEDELPEGGQFVICFVQYGRSGSETYAGKFNITDKTIRGPGFHVTSDATKAWRPLPDPPEWVEVE